MLQGIQAEVGQPGDIVAGGEDAEDAAFFLRPVEIALILGWGHGLEALLVGWPIGLRRVHSQYTSVCGSPSALSPAARTRHRFCYAAIRGDCAQIAIIRDTHVARWHERRWNEGCPDSLRADRDRGCGALCPHGRGRGTHRQVRGLLIFSAWRGAIPAS